MAQTFIDERSGRWVSPSLPDELADEPEAQTGIEKVRRLEREHAECLAAHTAAESARDEEIARDRAALAAARLTGSKKLPTADGIEKAEKAVKEAKRQLDAADDARREAAEELVALVTAHREIWAGRAEESAEVTQAEVAAALKAYLEAIDRRTRARERARWLREFPTRRAFKPHTGPLAHVGRLDPIPRADVTYGLLVDAGLADPPPRTLKEQVEARGLTPAAVIGGPSRDEAA
jgi:hypothetical protein